VITKIWRNQDMHPELKEACLDFTDFLSLNVYAANSNLMDDLLNSYFQWMDGAGFSYPSWWCLELNQGATEEINPGDWEWRHDVNKFDVSYIESVFNHGASVVTLFPSNWEAMPSAQFFDSEGNPVPKLTEIAGELERLQATIATIECPSVIVTANAGQITTTGAILNGSLDDIGTDDEVLVSFEWGTNPGSYTFETEAQTLQNTGTFSTTITGLNPDTMYYYRAKGIGDSVCYGEEKSFSTIATQIAVTTNEAAAITSESARLTGTLEQIDAASDVNVSFMWSEAVRSLDFETAVQTVNETGEFYIDLQELKPDTTYYYQAKAVGESTVYGDILSFTTRSVSPLVETVYVDDLTGSSVTLNGSLNNLGSASEVIVSFEWGTSSGNYSNETTPETMTTTGTFSFSLDGLNSDSTYYYRAKAIGNGTSYGVEKDFIPPAISTEPPIAATYDATNINESSAQLKGSLENTGTAETIQVYFQYSDSPGEYNEEILVQEMEEEGTFDYILGGLNAGATYYFRTKAIGDGTSYGEEKSFTTTEESTTAPDRPIILSMKTSVILKWNAVDGATNYILQVSTSPDCSSEYIFNEDVGKTTKQKVKGLTVDRTYYWRLKAGNSSGFSDWSPIWSFTIQ
jgi:phosphodiesterase/alkaline phosphatase D-like protein